MSNAEVLKQGSFDRILELSVLACHIQTSFLSYVYADVYIVLVIWLYTLVIIHTTRAELWMDVMQGHQTAAEYSSNHLTMKQLFEQGLRMHINIG